VFPDHSSIEDFNNGAACLTELLQHY